MRRNLYPLICQKAFPSPLNACLFGSGDWYMTGDFSRLTSFCHHHPMRKKCQRFGTPHPQFWQMLADFRFPLIYS
jgi:hypothetical protein